MQINLKTFYPLDTQSIIHSSNKAFFMERQLKKTQLFQQNICTRLSFHIYRWLWGAEVCDCVCVCTQRQVCVLYTHTSTNTRKDGSGCRHTGGGTAVHSVLAVSLRLPHSKSLNFSWKLWKSAIFMLSRGGELRPGSSPSSSRPSPSCPSSSSWGRRASSDPSSSSLDWARTQDQLRG